MSSHDSRIGNLFAFSGALILSFDTLLLRIVGGDPLRIALWRGVLMALSGVCAYCILRRFKTARVSLINGQIGMVVAALYGVASALFVTSTTLTSIANMLVIISTTPLWAAAGSALLLGEIAPLRTWIAAFVAFLGMAVVAWPGLESGTWKGDATALLTAVCMAGAFIASRKTHANLALAPAVGGLLSAVLIFPFVGTFQFDHTSQSLVMVVEGAGLVPIALGLIAIAPRYLPASQVGLFLLMETVLGPIWVWTALGERPDNYTLVGAAIVLMTLIVHSVLGLRAEQQS
jgi:drug/metabolite transporter (DMT)-like permease